MLKHGRFMQNLEVHPVYPKPIEEVANDGEENGDGAENSGDE